MIAFAAALLMQAQMQAPPANPAPARAHAAPSFEVLSRQAAEARDTKRLGGGPVFFKETAQTKPGLGRRPVGGRFHRIRPGPIQGVFRRLPAAGHAKAGPTPRLDHGRTL